MEPSIGTHPGAREPFVRSCDPLATLERILAPGMPTTWTPATALKVLDSAGESGRLERSRVVPALDALAATAPEDEVTTVVVRFAAAMLDGRFEERRHADILEFVPDAEIDAGLYVKSAYYLEPESVGVKPFYLLKQALDEAGKVAIGKIALRDREHLCRIALHGKGIVLNTLHWPDEIRDMGELSLPEESVEIRKQELAMARMLIENLSADFDPTRYHDEYREAVMQVVEAKVEHREVERPAEVEPPKVMDLMAALKASVEASKAGRPAAAESGADEEEAPTASRGRGRAEETATAARRETTRRRKAS